MGLPESQTREMKGHAHFAAPTIVTTFGRVVSAEFIGALVQGLPELPCGTPALALFANVLRRGADAVPQRYGDALGEKVYRVTKRTFRHQEVIEEAMLAFVVTAVRGRVYLAAGSPLPRAESYVFTAVANAAKNVLRGRWRRRRGEIPLDPETDLDQPRTQYVDPRSIDEEDRMATALDLRAAMAVHGLGCGAVAIGHGGPKAQSPPKTSSKPLRP
jgi:DNA-directed RNA polymerase specialized sigma24 family protein